MDRQNLLASTILLVFFDSFGVSHASSDSLNDENNAPFSAEMATCKYAHEARQPAEIDRFPDLYPTEYFLAKVRELWIDIFGPTACCKTLKADLRW